MLVDFLWEMIMKKVHDSAFTSNYMINLSCQNADVAVAK